jgi:hypothetical protein
MNLNVVVPGENNKEPILDGEGSALSYGRNNGNKNLIVGVVGNDHALSVASGFEGRGSKYVSKKMIRDRQLSHQEVLYHSDFRSSFDTTDVKNNKTVTHILDRDEIEKQERERIKQTSMSKNLIDILFMTDQDREKEKLKAEKEKLKAASIASKSSMKDTE